jgi:hypothetical protein
MEWKWSINESYEKSRRRPQLQENANINTETSAFYQALLSENDSWTINEIPIGLETKMELNKRENVYNKMGERENMGQRGMNPFNIRQTYINDVMTQDNFLKPVSTSEGRENK